MLFNKYYANSQNTIPYFWMPKYCNASDSSARTLEIYKKINNNVYEKMMNNKKIL
jgi:asparagine synthase (glutamine-hydrolysing)